MAERTMGPVQISAVILTTLGDLEGPGIAGVMYAAMMERTDLDTFNAAISILQRADLVTVNHHQLTLTAAGKRAADAVNKAFAERPKA